MNLKEFKIIIVGSGFFGLTIAEHITREFNIKVAVLEKRDHIGGNAFSYLDPESGIEIHKYGSHIFHTSSDTIWEYVKKFSEFNDYRHYVWSKHKDQTYSLPVNLLTLEQFFGRSFTPTEALEYFNSLSPINNDKNLLNKAVSSVGIEIYNLLIKGYTQKQWGDDPANLPAETITRLPVRNNFNLRYFSDKYEGIPTDGYGNLLSKMASSPNIEIFLNTDFFSVKNYLKNDALVIYTGPLDQFFNFKFGRLSWRTLKFELEKLPMQDFQGTSVMNYAELEVPFTRIHEFKHFMVNSRNKSNSTIIMREYSKEMSQDDEPYYPVNSMADREKLENYRKLIKLQKNVYFGGRLGSYQYLDMHMAISSAIQMYNNQLKPKIKLF